jgi:hypothetical protein
MALLNSPEGKLPCSGWLCLVKMQDVMKWSYAQQISVTLQKDEQEQLVASTTCEATS